MKQTNMPLPLDGSVAKLVANQPHNASNALHDVTAKKVGVRGLTMIRPLPTRLVGRKVRSFGEFKCNVCGKLIEMERGRASRNASCGCFNARMTHGAKTGYRRTPLYGVWTGIKQRTLNPRCKGYKWYGGRGITLCAEWMEFAPFAAWAEKSGYQAGLEIDRKDVNKGYEPLNCRWVTSQVNVQNRRITTLDYEITHAVKLLASAGMTDVEISHVTKVRSGTVRRIRNGELWRDTDVTGVRYDEMLSRMRANNPKAT